MIKRIAATLALLGAATFLVSQSGGERQIVGPLPDGRFLLNSGYVLEPAGKQIPLDTLPMSSALSPDGKYMLVLNGGYKPPSISVLSVADEKEIGRTPVEDAWLGLTFSPDGKTVYAGGASRARLYEFAFANGQLTPGRQFEIVPAADRVHQDFIGDVAVSPDGRLIYAAMLYRDMIAVINPQSGRVIERYKTGRRPYRIMFHPDGKSFFVTSWADGSIYRHQATDGSLIRRIPVGQHPTDMVWNDRAPTLEENEDKPNYVARLFVSAANTNNVYAFGVSESSDLQLIETINIATTPRHPVGMTPSALALTPDKTRLYVVCSDENAVAVADVSGKRTRVQGFIPTGWYPTAARAMADGRLFVLNGRGLRSYANPNGPGPLRRAAPLHEGGQPAVVEYTPRIQTGTASVIAPFTDEQLDAYTKTVLKNSPYRDQLLEYVETGENNPVPPRPGMPSPIQHVIYIVKENRTYDQVFGDLGRGNGDPSLTLFNANTNPNQRKLVNEFVLLDNFYVNSDVSADGHNWATAAIATDYTHKMFPNSYAGRRKHYDYEGGEPANNPPAGYIWTNALQAGLSIRNYGYFCTNRPKADADGTQVAAIRDPMLAPVTNRKYRAFDLEYPDMERAKTFLADLAEFEKTGQMPRFVIMRLGNDHTSGTSAGKVAPLSAMADNDYALGMVVEGITKSRFWAQTAIFVVEDDAQNGPDHVDSHRSPALVISPFVRRGAIDSTMYNQTSVLRTMELILGVRPMTHFDAGARPMSSVFQAKADTRPYAAVEPKHPRDERNPAASPTAARSARMDFTEADLIDDDELNDILWRAIRGTEPPAPVSSFFAR
jgi:DNA-binding beta-propeller fold protein YncE